MAGYGLHFITKLFNLEM